MHYYVFSFVIILIQEEGQKASKIRVREPRAKWRRRKFHVPKVEMLPRPIRRSAKPNKQSEM